ncbi:MAG TPA: universal stress protein [Polyangiaceae bacterium]|nr:universal stress protein [Polyangiaceae bacterium]
MTDTLASTQKPYSILVGFDFSELGERAIQEALALASRSPLAELHVVTVAQQVGSLLRLPREPEALAEELARTTVRLQVGAIVDEYRKTRGPVCVDRVAVYVVGAAASNPAQVIVDLANALDASLIVVGTHGRSGLARMLLGSVAEHVVRHAGTSVHVVRPADFVGGERVPAIEPPLHPGEPHLRHFEARRIYHHVDRSGQWTTRTMPVT